MMDEQALTTHAGQVATAAVSGITGAGVVRMLGEGFALANKIIDYIDDPFKRAKARREYLDSLEAIREKIKGEKDIEAINLLLLDLITAVHNK